MPQDSYDKIMTLAKQRGLLYPSFEIYGGCAGFYDYGPLGSLLKNNVENLWRRFFLFQDDCYEINTPTITLYEVLKASGHVDEFTDLTIDCPQCKISYKLEGLLPKGSSTEVALSKKKVKCPTCGNLLQDPYSINLMFATKIGVGEGRKAFLRPETAQGIFTDFHFLYRFAREKLPFGVIQVGRGYRNEVSPRQGPIRMREFSMAEAEIFIDPLDKTHPHFNLVKDKHLHLYDNEKEIIISLKDAVSTDVINNQALAYYMYLTQDFLMSLGIDAKKFRFRKHGVDEIAHYAQECWDVELYSERFGWIECVGIADRSAYDLNAHINSSGTDMYAMRKYATLKGEMKNRVIPNMSVLGPLFKQKARRIREQLEKYEPIELKKVIITLDGEHIEIPKNGYTIVSRKEKNIGKKFVPHVIEPSFGIDRIIYCLLEHNYREQKKKDENYRILQLNQEIAPIKVGVFPLINDKKLILLAKKINVMLRNAYIYTYYDESGSIGRRYARMDEIGTPFCITVDFESLEDAQITIRERDTTKQVRQPIDTLISYFKQKFYF